MDLLAKFGPILLVIPFGFFSYVKLKAFYEQRQRRAVRRRVFRGIISVIAAVPDDQAAIQEMCVLFKTWKNDYLQANGYFRSLSDAFEALFYRYTCYSKENFKSSYGLEISEEHYRRIRTLMIVARDLDPFGGVSAHSLSILQEVHGALDTGDKQQGMRQLKLLAESISGLERSVVEHKSHSEEAKRMSTVGIVLTIVFGLLSLVPLFWEPRMANQPPEPTTTAVTPPAAQEPRQGKPVLRIMRFELKSQNHDDETTASNHLNQTSRLRLFPIFHEGSGCRRL